MTPMQAHLAAKARRQRGIFDAEHLAAALGCEVTVQPDRPEVFEAVRPLPGVYVLIGGAEEILAAVRAEVRARELREWIQVLGTLGGTR